MQATRSAPAYKLNTFVTSMDSVTPISDMMQTFNMCNSAIRYACSCTSVYIFLCSSVSMFTFSFIFLYFFCATYTLKFFYLVISAYTFVICSLKINHNQQCATEILMSKFFPLVFVAPCSQCLKFEKDRPIDRSPVLLTCVLHFTFVASFRKLQCFKVGWGKTRGTF